MSLERHTSTESPEMQAIKPVIDSLRDIDETLSCTLLDDTYEIDADTFTLNVVITDEVLEIRSIDVRGNVGRGRLLIEALHSYADDRGLATIASNVRDEAQGFWETMGYQESSEDPQTFFWVAGT